MAFQEKSAWVMFLALLFTGLFYCYAVVSSSATGAVVPPTVPGMVEYTLLLVLIAVVGHVVIALWSPREAAASLDERERAIVARASRFAGYLQSTGVVLSLGAYLINRQGDLLFYGVFASLITAEVAQYLVQIYLYRR
jgi:Na+-driven multidrug efflux pump